MRSEQERGIWYCGHCGRAFNMADLKLPTTCYEVCPCHEKERQAEKAQGGKP